MAQLEIDNHQVQVEQALEAEEFIRSKFSNEQLYHWMGSKLKDRIIRLTVLLRPRQKRRKSLQVRKWADYFRLYQIRILG